MKTVLIQEVEFSELIQKIEELRLQKNDAIKKELLREPVSNQEFIKLMGISSRCAQNWRDKGIIEFYKIGDKIYYSWESIHRMLDTHRVKSFKGC